MADYRRFERELVLELPNETIDAINGAVLCGKLLQFASGVVYDGNRIAHPIHDEKLLELQSLVEETLDEPVLVAYWFKSTLRRLKELFPRAAVMDREGKQVEPWNKRKYKMMLVHPQSVGHGLNLQYGGHHIAVVDMFYSLELFTQLIGRLDRPGQTKTVQIHLLAARGTIDETVAMNLEHLRRAEDEMFRRLQELRRGLNANDR
jgi:SNF2 family DNA or RNA helicase